MHTHTYVHIHIIIHTQTDTNTQTHAQNTYSLYESTKTLITGVMMIRSAVRKMERLLAVRKMERLLAVTMDLLLVL